MYLHANTRCRLAVLEYLGYLLSAGFSAFAFDFSGCGLSEGNHVGNGLKEKEDVDAAVALLKKNPQITGKKKKCMLGWMCVCIVWIGWGINGWMDGGCFCLLFWYMNTLCNVNMHAYRSLESHAKLHPSTHPSIQSGIAIWGHSMGAAAALMHTETNSSIQALILDSCFATMRQLVRDAVVSAGKEGFGLPNFVVEAGIQALR